MGAESFFRSKGYKNMMAKVYGIGAAIVIAGALFKILHLPGAAFMLTLGMGTECIIFILSSFEPLHTELDWTLVYPELLGVDNDEIVQEGRVSRKGAGSNDAVSQKLDQMLQEANIGPELIESLAQGLRNLNNTTQNLSASADITVTNNKYIGELSKLTENLNALNAVYESQVKNSQLQMDVALKAQENLQTVIANQLEKAAASQASLDRIIENLTGTLESSEHYKNIASNLSQNVDALNNVYSGMLAAMSGANKK